MTLFFKYIKKILLISTLLLYPMALLAECGGDPDKRYEQGTTECIDGISGQDGITIKSCPDGNRTIQGIEASDATCVEVTQVPLTLALPYAECASGLASTQGTSEGTGTGDDKIECTQDRKTVTLENYSGRVGDNEQGGFKIGDMNASHYGVEKDGTFSISGEGSSNFYINSDYEIKVDDNANIKLDSNTKIKDYSLSVVITNKAGISRRVDFNIQVFRVDLYITNAFFDDNGTADDETDDKLYIQYNVDLDTDTIPSTISDAFVVDADIDGNGGGSIDQEGSSTSDYNATISYYNHIINLVDPEPLKDYNISIDANKDTSLFGLNGEKAEPFNTIIKKAINYDTVQKTGQILSYNNSGDNIKDQTIKDDGYYQAGAIPRFTRDNDSKIVTDHILGLEWVDDEEHTKLRKYWLTEDKYIDCRDHNESCYDTTVEDEETEETAATYCEELNFDSRSGWELPTRSELETLIDYSKSEKTIHSIFQHISTGFKYWTSDTYIKLNDDDEKIYDSAWVVDFDTASTTSELKYDEDKSHYVRCVREID